MRRPESRASVAKPVAAERRARPVITVSRLPPKTSRTRISPSTSPRLIESRTIRPMWPCPARGSARSDTGWFPLRRPCPACDPSLNVAGVSAGKQGRLCLEPTPLRQRKPSRAGLTRHWTPVSALAAIPDTAVQSQSEVDQAEQEVPQQPAADQSASISEQEGLGSAARGSSSRS